jgi:hypothetical protein
MTKIIVAVVLVLSATSLSLAQSQRNYGANGPSRSDCFGQPYGGAAADKCPGENGSGSRYWHHRQ